jgi:hypothetical protein
MVVEVRESHGGRVNKKLALWVMAILVASDVIAKGGIVDHHVTVSTTHSAWRRVDSTYSGRSPVRG